MNTITPPSGLDDRIHVHGHHAHAQTGERYTYQASYSMQGSLVDWTAHVRAGGRMLASIGGSIRLGRGQTRGMAGTLVIHMVAQSIDAMRASMAPA